MRRGASILGWLIASSVSALGILVPIGPAVAEVQAAASLCDVGEDVVFSCVLDAKTASLCAATTAGAIGRLTYRYGTGARIETSYTAEPENGHRFKITVAPANPRALVRQIWFDRGSFRTLLSECIGGGCARSAGLSVLRGNKVVRNSSCGHGAGSQPWFSRELADFGFSDHPTSKTGLLSVEEADNLLEKLY